MPNVIFHTTPETHAGFSDRVFGLLALKMKQVVADALQLSQNDVGVSEVVAARTLDAGNLQIQCLASASMNRLERLGLLREMMIEGVKDLANEDKECGEFFASLGSVEAWALMPEGSWGETTF